MPTLTLKLLVDDAFAANLPPDATLVVLAIPEGGLAMLKAALAFTAGVVERTGSEVAGVRAILDDPQGTPAAMAAALAQLALLVEDHDLANGDVVHALLLLDTAIVARLGGAEGAKAMLQ